MKQTVKLSFRKDLLRVDGIARVDFVINFKGKQSRVSSGKSLEPKYWNAKLSCVDKECPDALEINSYLTEKLASVDKFVKTKEILNEKYSLNDLKLILKGQSVEKKVKIQKTKYPTLSEAFASYVANTELKRSTVINYDTTRSIILDFCKKKYKRELTINEVDFNFLEKFKTYLRTERERPNCKNTIAKRFKILKSIYLYADNQGHIEKNAFKGYRIEHGKHREVALSADEYNKMRNVKLPENACNSMRVTKYIFVFCCETGLRYSDAMDLRWEHFNEEENAIKKAQVKTGKDVFIPISNQAKAIMILYKKQAKDLNGYVFPRIDNQVMNRYLKEIAKIAGINKNVTTHIARHRILSFSLRVSKLQEIFS